MEANTRDWRVQVITSTELIEIDKLAMQFRVEKSTKVTQNSLDISIFGLADTTAAKIQESGNQIILYAGYFDGTSGAEVIYIGDIVTAFGKNIFPGTVVNIEAGDGNNAVKKKSSSISFAAGVTLKTIVNKLIVDIGLPKGKISGDMTKSFTTGFSFAGKSVAALAKVTKEAGLEFSIQNNEIQILDSKSDLENTAILLDATSGLLGSPELLTPDKNITDDKVRLRVEALLNPKMHIGSIINLNSARYTGEFKITNLNLSGDTHSNNWKATIEVETR